MVAKRRKRNRKIASKMLFLLLLIATLVVGYFVWDGYFREKEIPKEDDDIVAVPEQDEVVEATEVVEPEKKVEKEKIEQFDGDNPNENNTLSGVITYAGVSGEYLMIRVNIDQYLSGGSCNLSLMRDGTAIFGDTATIIDAVATSTCEGFNVPLSSLGEGQLKIVINLNAGDKIGVIEGEVKI